MFFQKLFYLYIALTMWFVFAPDKVQLQDRCLFGCRLSKQIHVLFGLFNTKATADHLVLNKDLLRAHLVETLIDNVLSTSRGW